MAAYSLRHLEAELYRTVAVSSSEKDANGMYVWRDKDGLAWFWSPMPVRYEHHTVQTVAEADSIMFLCPLCFEKNGGAVGTHSVMVTFAGRGVPDEAGSRGEGGKATRWNVSGTSLDDLSLTPSIALNQSCQDPKICQWHGFVGSSGIPAGHAG